MFLAGIGFWTLNNPGLPGAAVVHCRVALWEVQGAYNAFQTCAWFAFPDIIH